MLRENNSTVGQWNREGKLRLSKFIARSGYCSRRAAEDLIASGAVLVNGCPTNNEQIYFVDSSCQVMVGSKKIDPFQMQTRLWLYHKPPGVITTKKDPQKRLTVFDSLPKTMPHTISVGRLDYNSEGLLLLTNNPLLAHKLALPRNGMQRVYKVFVSGGSLSVLHKFVHGVVVGNILYRADKIAIHSKDNKNGIVFCHLSEGKNREIRRVFEALGCRVLRLIRVAYGSFVLGNLQSNEVLEVDNNEVGALSINLHDTSGSPNVGNELVVKAD